VELDDMMLAMLNSMAAPALHREPDQIIGRGEDDAAPYMERWFLMRKATGGPVENVYLHRFLRGDGDEHPHDHPWAWTTIILRGGYVEQTSEGEFTRKAGDVAMKAATDVHMITSVEPGTVTLFLTGPKVRDWGFHTPDGIIPERNFATYKRLVANEPAKAPIFANQCRLDAPKHGHFVPVARAPGAMVFGGGTMKQVPQPA
jgi:quercetin dioxygenase-like cupin family protein